MRFKVVLNGKRIGDWKGGSSVYMHFEECAVYSKWIMQCRYYDMSESYREIDYPQCVSLAITSGVAV